MFLGKASALGSGYKVITSLTLEFYTLHCLIIALNKNESEIKNKVFIKLARYQDITSSKIKKLEKLKSNLFQFLDSSNNWITVKSFQMYLNMHLNQTKGRSKILTTELHEHGNISLYYLRNFNK